MPTPHFPVFNMAMHNRAIWKSPASRATLHEIAWAVVKKDKHSDLAAANIYNSIRDDLAKKHPTWFKEDDDFQLEPSDEPATKGDVQQLAGHISDSHQAFQLLGQSQRALNERLGWVWWFSLGALVASLWKHS